MDVTPVSGADDLKNHLREVLDAPDTLLDAKLIDDVQLQLTEFNTPPLVPKLLPLLTAILATYPHEPTVLIALAIKLLKPIRFTQAMTLASEESLIQALQSPAPSAAILAMTVIEKAAKSPGDTAILSIMQGVIAALIRTWLSSPSVEVGEKATKTLGDLLEVDCDKRPPPTLNAQINGDSLAIRVPAGQGLLWRLIFGNMHIYSSILSLCSFKSSDGEIDERQKSLAQARLLRILPRLAALDFRSITHTNFPDVEAQYNIGADNGGLLYFAAVEMVNKEDVLMHITLIDFFAEFLATICLAEISASTMEYLSALMRRVTENDESMYKSLESLALSPRSSPELIDLLVHLNTSR